MESCWGGLARYSGRGGRGGFERTAIGRGRGGVEVVADLSSNTEGDHSRTQRGGRGWMGGWESASEQGGKDGEEERSGRPPTGER